MDQRPKIGCEHGKEKRACVCGWDGKTYSSSSTSSSPSSSSSCTSSSSSLALPFLPRVLFAPTSPLFFALASVEYPTLSLPLLVERLLRRGTSSSTSVSEFSWSLRAGWTTRQHVRLETHVTASSHHRIVELSMDSNKVVAGRGSGRKQRRRDDEVRCDKEAGREYLPGGMVTDDGKRVTTENQFCRWDREF